MSGFGNRNISGLRWSLGGNYSFIFLPKLIYSYRHPNANEPPWPLPDSIPVLPTADTNTNQYQAKYQYRPPKPPKTDWKAAVKLLDKNYRYGNQNFFYKKDIYSWWHSAGGDLPVGICHPALFEWVVALGFSVFPVHEADGASVSKSSLERLPCYTPSMTTMRWINDEGPQSDPLYLFGYFVEADEQYYWYQLKPILYKNNKPLYDYSDGLGLITFICGFYKGDIEFSDESIHSVEIVAYQVNMFMTPGDVQVEVLVRDLTSGEGFNQSLYTILGGGLIMNGLNWPIRFSEDGTKMAGLFHCAESGNRDIGYFNEHILLAEFSIDFEAASIRRTSRERFKYTRRDYGGGEQSTENTTTDTWFNTDLSVNEQYLKYEGLPCQTTVGRKTEAWKQTIDERTISITEKSRTSNVETTGVFAIGVNYNKNELLRADIIYEYYSSTVYEQLNEGWSGHLSETFTQTEVASKGTGLGPNIWSSSNHPYNVIRDAEREYKRLNNGSWGCVGWQSAKYWQGLSLGTARAGFRDTGTRNKENRDKTRDESSDVILQITDEPPIQFVEYTENEVVNYNNLSRSMPASPSVSYYRERRNLVSGGYSETDTDYATIIPTFYEESDRWHEAFQRTIRGNDVSYQHSGTLTAAFSVKELSFLDLRAKLMLYVQTEGEYERSASSNRLNQDVIIGDYLAVFKKGQPNTQTSYPDVALASDESTSVGDRLSKQSVAIVLKKYGDGGYERYISAPQEVEKNDTFSNTSFIANSISFSVVDDYDNSDEYDFPVSSVFSSMDLHSSRGVAARSHIEQDDLSVYLASLFYQKINFYFSPRDTIFGSYFPPVNEFYSYQLKGIDTNVPPSVGASLQDPVNPDDIDIGNQLCPIGFLRV